MAEEYRPNPDQLLQAIQEDEQREKRGYLKIFFGANAGVGKTFAMLRAAHERQREGADVAVGIVETHGRVETEELVKGLEIIPRRNLSHRETTLQEFDIDAALVRHPQLLLLDELAHTNAPGSRHPKRWQDVEELLAAGIDIYTTLNVQHLESLNDVLAEITGVWVKETVPDSIFEQADDITLVDIPSDDLLKRLREGKVYLAPTVKERAAENFFKKDNLIALRELALRRTAAGVDAQALRHRQRGSSDARMAGERLLVCIGPQPLSRTLIQTTKRLSDALDAPWTAMYIENDRHYRLSGAQREAVERHMQLAQQIGGRAEVVQAADAANALIAYAREHGITKIVIGKTHQPRWREIWRGTLADKLVRLSSHIDVHVVTDELPKMPAAGLKSEEILIPWREYVWTLTIVAGAVGLMTLLQPYLEPVNLAMLTLAAVVLVAERFGRGPSVFASVISVLAFDYFFIPPFYSFAVSDMQYLVTFVALLIIGLLVSSQALRLRRQASFSQHRERHTAALYALTRELTTTRGVQAISAAACRHIADAFQADAFVFLPDKNDELVAEGTDRASIDMREFAAAAWAYKHKQAAGIGTSTLSGTRSFFTALLVGERVLGVLSVTPHDAQARFDSEQAMRVEAFASVLATSLARAQMGEKAERIRVEAEGEKLRNVILSSVSHDLRTPLASITGAASTLLTEDENLPSETRQDLIRSIHDEGTRLAEIVTNLLDVSSLESGSVRLNRDYYAIDELLGSAFIHSRDKLKRHKIHTSVERDLPLLYVDGLLIKQVFTNLLENAVRYSPPQSQITILARKEDDDIRVEIYDYGSGIPKGEEAHIFDKFYSAHDKQRGTGMGLAICRGIIQAHAGRIWAENAPGGGAIFIFTLPLTEIPVETMND